jgi:hypothetical protein
MLVAPFALEETLSIESGSLSGHEVEVQIIDCMGDPVPFAILQLTWPNFGFLAFQSDDGGRLSVRFDSRIIASRPQISVLVKPTGQDLTRADFATSTPPLEAARVRLSW